jgi:uncharacterized membrane protein
MNDISKHPLDPYPHNFLTLVMSWAALVIGGVIMMAQNRQANRDRQRDERVEFIITEASKQIKVIVDLAHSEEMQ